LPINKNRKGVKINVIVDDFGSPLIHSINDSTIHDSKIGYEDIHKLANNKTINNSLKNTKGYPYLLADSGYDSNKIKMHLKNINFKHIINPNNKNNKRKRKKRIPKRYRKKYLKRIKVEHFFAIIKKHPKINCIYERKIISFDGLIMFLFGSILLNRIDKY
jgi:hypothetical protein